MSDLLGSITDGTHAETCYAKRGLFSTWIPKNKESNVSEGNMYMFTNSSLQSNQVNECFFFYSKMLCNRTIKCTKPRLLVLYIDMPGIFTQYLSCPPPKKKKVLFTKENYNTSSKWVIFQYMSNNFDIYKSKKYDPKITCKRLPF